MGRALRDRSPWIRRQAAEGILLLADRVDTYFADAVEHAATEMASPDNWDRPEEYGRLFERSTRQAAARFGDALLRWLAAHETEEDYPYFDAIESLLEARPDVFPELVPALTVLLATPRDATGKASSTAWYLRKLQAVLALDFAPAGEAFLRLLASPSIDERRAAVYVVGQLTSVSSELAESGFRELEQAVANPDFETAARAAFSLQSLAELQPELSGQVGALLVRGLERPRLRSAFAEALA